MSNMSDKDDDLWLAREIKNLDREMEPTRELWVGIERKILDHPQPSPRHWHHDWMPWGIAASLLVAVTALAIAIVDPGRTEGPAFVSREDSIRGMQAEYLAVRNPLVEQFDQTNRNLAPAVREDLHRNLEIMAQARRDIEAQVRENPDDDQLIEMLMWIHEQELELLRQDYSRPRSM